MAGAIALTAGGVIGPLLYAPAQDTDNPIAVFNTTSMALLSTLNADQGLTTDCAAVAVNAAGNLLVASQTEDPFLRFIDCNPLAHTWAENTTITITQPTSRPTAIAFSPDGAWLAVGLESAPFIALYQTSNWSKRADPATTPAGTVARLAFSPNGTWCAFTHNNSPRVTIYTVSNWTKIANPGTLPTGNASGCDFSPNSAVLAIGHFNSPFITLYNTSDFSKISNPGVLPTAIAWDCKFSPNGVYLALRTGVASPYSMIYTVSGWTVFKSTELDDAGAGERLGWNNEQTQLWTDTYFIFDTATWLGTQSPTPPAIAADALIFAP